MEFGLKLNPDEAARPYWMERLGDTPTFLARARALGAGFVEIVYKEEMAPARLVALGRQAGQAGLGFSVHPYLFGPLAAEVFEPARAAVHEPLLRAAGEVSQRCREPVTLVYHAGRAGCQPHNRPLEEAAAAARRFFRWLGARVTGAWPDLQVFCETQYPAPPDEGWHRVGDTYESCLELVAGTGVGLCWDFGHTFASALQGKHAGFPPAEFVARVGHVHAHDTAEVDGRTLDHRPLGSGFSPWREYFRLLGRAGFAGRVLLEVGLWVDGGYDELKEILDFAAGEVGPIFRRPPEAGG